ncbi:Transmembrane emp24 domain-containing protein p24 delta 9 [Abeliophyllum distichum]|uniref:Transmembrane emp24 domain-containing protein p24 delta 9 n=1 Tax=Abeliophyllum distichum TaxID=126358 RepID=A0ABD1VZU2_9LAMI
MQIERWSLLLILISGFLLWRPVKSIRFELESSQTKCIAEELKINTMTLGKYHIVNSNEGHPLPDSHNITVGVTSIYGNAYHHADNVDEGQFAFQAMEEGDYLACFFAANHEPSATITIDFDWKFGVAAKDWTNVAKKDSVQLMELELKKMLENVASIHDEMLYLREREEEMQKLNRSTNSKMAGLSFLWIFVNLSAAGLQLWHLKFFFEKKKLL